METTDKKLWRSPLGKWWVILLILITLLTTILKINSQCYFIRRSYFQPDKKEIVYDFFDLILYGAWLIGPPFFFLVEYVFMFGKDANRRMDTVQVADLKYCHDLASKIWAGVGVLLGVMLLIRYGIKF